MLEEEYQTRRRLPRELRPAPLPEPAFSFEIRPAVAADLPYVREIYNHYVQNSTVTFDEEPMTLADWRRKAGVAAKLGMPFLVAVNPAGEALGYATAMPWGGKAAYRYTVESSIYLRAASTGKGLGRALLEALVEACREAGIREMVAVIADKNAEASIRLHESLGFTEVGRMGRVGFKFGRWLGTVTMQKSLKKRRRGE
ncbi:GNAT family N-acetyltransferase [Frigoribacterium endophyticum]|uniref:GNAT family N-acetyltransferase n=1 Tax=Frigoribacterium endophyticum TaxID=1522176 RepID=UPI00141DC3D6|nr:phosphinothricin acetyltransferase [Frigoribacterium endophyticum]